MTRMKRSVRRRNQLGAGQNPTHWGDIYALESLLSALADVSRKEMNRSISVLTRWKVSRTSSTRWAILA